MTSFKAQKVILRPGKLKEIWESLGLTQDELAGLAGVNISSLGRANDGNRIERGTADKIVKGINKVTRKEGTQRWRVEDLLRTDEFKVFIIGSRTNTDELGAGIDGYGLAVGLEDMISQVFQAATRPVKPLVVARSGSGRQWAQELAQLDSADVVIVCVTSSNYRAPWLHYEVGACAGRKPVPAYVFLFDNDEIELGEPLKDFTIINGRNRNEVQHLLSEINRHLGDGVDHELLNSRFHAKWDTFDDALCSRIADDETNAPWTRYPPEAKLWIKALLRQRQTIQTWTIRDGASTRTTDFKGIIETFANREGRPDDCSYFLVRGPAGVGKSVLLHRYLATRQPSEACLVDVNQLLYDSTLTPFLIQERVQRSLAHLTPKKHICTVILDGLDGAARKIAILRGLSSWTILEYLFDNITNEIRRTIPGPLLLLLSGDDQCDGEPTPLLTKLEEKIPKPKSVFHLELSNDEPRRWSYHPIASGRVATDPSHRRLAIFLDAYLVSEPNDIPNLLQLLKRHADYILDNETTRLGLCRHFLHEAAYSVLDWIETVFKLQDGDKKSLEACIGPIIKEQTWEWLYLLMIGYKGATDVISRLWRLHDVIRNGSFRTTLALSNLVSLLVHLGEFGNNGSIKYIHCNLQGVLLQKISNIAFHGSDLTRAVRHKDLSDPTRAAEYLNGAKFVCCLFDSKQESDMLSWLRRFKACQVVDPWQVTLSGSITAD